MISLTVLREQNESKRFDRQQGDDSRTALPVEAAQELAAELGRRLRGEVRFDAGSRALYATDGSNYRMAPIGVVIPRDKDDVIATVETARRFGAPILGRGCGTSLAGQCCNVAVVMDFSKYMNRVLNIHADHQLGTVEPGCVLDNLRNAAIQQGLNFAPDPATHSHCTLGGMLGNDSCGSHSLLAAKHGRGLRTADNTQELEILTYEGLRLRVGTHWRSAVGGDHSRRRAARRTVPQAPRLPRPLRRRDPHPLSQTGAARVGLQPRRIASRERL